MRTSRSFRPLLARPLLGVFAAAAAAVALACQQPSTDVAPALLKLPPTAVISDAGKGAEALFDRDTTRGVALERSLDFRLTWAQGVQLQRVKAFARGPVRVEVEGLPALELQGAGEWESLSLTGKAPTAGDVRVRLVPLAPGARVEELELWGPGAVRAPDTAQALAERSRDTGNLGLAGVHVFSAQPADATLRPRGTGEGSACATLRLGAPLPLGTVRRAHLVYEARGVQRPSVLLRSLGGRPAQGGVWLGSSQRERTLADELNPEWLTGQDAVTLCLPDAATDTVELRNVRLLLEQDDGSHPFEREVALRLAAALDGDPRTSAALAGGTLELGFSRTTSMDSAQLEVDSPATDVGSAFHDGAEWHELGQVAFARGRNALALDGRAARAVRLSFPGARRPDVPGASVAELLVTGSGIGPRLAAPRLVLAQPSGLRALAGDRLSAEHFSGRAYLAGWAESPAGPGAVTVDGVPVDFGDGSFGIEVRRPAGPDVWSVKVAARFADGTTTERTVVFDRDAQAELDADAVGDVGSAGSEDLLFGAEEQTAWGRVDGERGGKVRLGERAEFDAPPGAVDGPLSVGITRKMPEALPPMDPGLVNVTAPRNAGYRFSPPGQQFKKAVTIRLPYDPELLPEGVPPEQVQTYYFDKGRKQWVPLARKGVQRATRQVESETTHFTFMINAVLVMPDHPGPASFNPNSIKDLKVGDPAAGIELMQPPTANSHGTARVGLSLQLPGARGAYSPSLQLAYDSSGGNGWVGVGWDLGASSISVDGRFGAPFHDGSERFVLDGEQLVPVGTGPCVAGGTGRRFAARVERSFQRVVRCAEGTALDHFEVAQQDGVLRLYGVTAAARVADPAAPLAIGQWMLERVLDVHENLTVYRYREDKRTLPGTAFDRNNAEDFRQLYLRQILYSGKVARASVAADAETFETAADFGIYLVQLDLEGDGADPLERPDVITSGRLGFKTVTRYRLGAVRVQLNTKPDTSVVREYRFDYEQGDFGKSRLETVKQYGVGGLAAGALFHTHALEYTSVDDHGAGAFTDVVRMPLDASEGTGSDNEAMTATKDWSIGAHAYVGIGFSEDKQKGSIGARVGFNHRESTTRASFFDINGDGLPDRVAMGSRGLEVQLNDPKGWLSPLAPEGDPHAGQRVTPVKDELSLGVESSESINLALQGTFTKVSLNVGNTATWSRSSSFTLDADGDGLVDFVNGGSILFNQPRGTAGCPTASFCFWPSKAVTGALDFSNLAGAQATFADDPAIAEAARDAEREFHPSDALQEWTAPYSGTVDISGALAWVEGRSSTGPDADGVRLRVYRNSDLLGEYRREASETRPTAVSHVGVQVRHRDTLYFVVSTLKNVAISAQGVAAEEVDFAPVIRYRSCSGDCGGMQPSDADLTGPTGAPLFTFDAAEDFRLGGGPMVAIQAPRSGTLKVSGTYKSAGVAEDVRICIQHFLAKDQPVARACAAGDLLLRTYPSGEGEETLSETFGVSSGDSLVFKVDTDFPIDPDAVKWNMEGEMTEVCVAPGKCAPPPDRDRERLHFVADAFVPLHTPAEDVALRPLVIPRDGTLHLHSSFGWGGQGGEDQRFSARMGTRLLLKHGPDETREVSVEVRAGDRVYFQAHSPTYAGRVGWEVTAELEERISGSGTRRTRLDVPRHFTNEMLDNGPFREPKAPPTSPFGGGYHGWRYGVWGGRPAQPARPDEGIEARPEELFDHSVFYTEPELDLGDGSDREKFRDGKSQVRDEESEVARRIRLFAPLVGRRSGTKLYGNALGLKPGPAFVSADGTTFVAKGRMHGAQKGVLATAPNGSVRTLDASFRIGDTSRASVSGNFAAGLGVSFESGAGYSMSVSAGTTSQRMDVRDMNGDGIIDVIVNGRGKGDGTRGNGVRLTHLHQRTLRKTIPGEEKQLSESSDLTVSMGMGVSSPVPQVSARGGNRGSIAMYPSSAGAGLAATLSATDLDLVDVNADGLPDLVRRDASGFRVRLNLGGRFAEAEDTLPVAAWRTEGSFDPFAASLGVESVAGADDDEKKGRAEAESARQRVADPNVVRRSSAVTLETNLGFTIAEDYGATANWSSSLSGTQVVLTDVTGDGLPDYVRKSSGESAFRVKVNQGYGFGPEQVWNAGAWPKGVLGPRLRLDTAGAVQNALELLQLHNGIDTVEASGSHSRVPAAGFVFTVPVRLLIPVLHLSFGADVTPERLSGVELSLQDINGDGLADHVLKTEEIGSMPGVGPLPNGANQNAVFARINRYAGGNLLRKVSRPLGGSFTLTYGRAGNTVDLPHSRDVLERVEVDDGTRSADPGHVLATDYSYDGGRYDRAEREFYGFATVTRINADGSRHTQTYANDTFARRGLLLREEVSDSQKRLFLATVNSYAPSVALALPQADCTAYAPFFLSAADYCAPSFTPLQRVERRQYEGQTKDVSRPGMTSAQTFEYDNATGNVKVFEDLGDVADPGDDHVATMTYFTNPALGGLHVQSRVKTLEVRAGTAISPGRLLRYREAEYTDLGDLESQTVRMSDRLMAKSELRWNADGMLENVLGPPNAAGEQYEVTYAYTDPTRALVTGTVDSFLQTSSSRYDLKFQQPVQQWDVNGNLTEQEFDDFGRLQRVWSPYQPRSGSPTITVSYRHDVFPAYAVAAQLLPDAAARGGDPTLDTIAFVDGLGRALQTKKDVELENDVTGYAVSGHLAYDAMGRIVEEGQPFFDAGDAREYVSGAPLNPKKAQFDVLNRRLVSETADGQKTEMQYDFGVPQTGGLVQARTTVTDPNDHVRILYRDGNDQLSAVEEQNEEGRTLTTRYARDPLKQLTSVIDTHGNVTSTGYNLVGQRIALQSPDAGLTEYDFDAAGNLVTRVDPNLRAAGLAVQYKYRYNRLERIVRPLSGEIRFDYGGPKAPENGVGRLVTVADESGVETRGYGRLGELVRTTRTVRALRPGDRERSFTTRFESDSFGRMLRVVYPDGEDLRYAYDDGGALRSAVGYRAETDRAPAEVQVYLRSLEYDVFGQRTRMVLGNGVVSTYEYEPKTRRLHLLKTNTPRGRKLQAITYGYDKVGNVKTMSNALGPPVGGQSGTVDYTYDYDALYRLTSAKGTAQARPGLVDRFTATFKYDDVHNMSRKTQVHELVSNHGAGVNAARPDHSNHDDEYKYDGAGPHQATRIGDTLYSYDANGNSLIECRTVNGSGCADTDGTTGTPETRNHYRRFVWTEDNTLRAVVEGGGNTTRFFYDAAGERVAKLGRGGTSLAIGQFFSVKGRRHGTKHIFAGGTRVASKLLAVTDEPETASAGTGTEQTVLANAVALGSDNDNGCVPSDNQPNKCPVVVTPPSGGETEAEVRPATYYYHPDHLGSTSWMTDQQGRVHEHVEYFPYGEVWRDGRHDSDGGPARTPSYLFTGKEFDEETGLAYFGARYYDARRARWVSPEPALEEFLDRANAGHPGMMHVPGTLSVYSYSHQNPINLADPDGRETVGELLDRKGVEAAGAGDNATTYMYAFAATTWSFFGAESVSQVADKGMGASTSHKVMAVVDIATLGKGGGAVAAARKWGAPLAKRAIGMLSRGAKGVDTLADTARVLPPLRQQYVDTIAELAEMVPSMRASGATPEAVARALHAERRAIGEQFKNLTPPEKLSEIYARNLAKYGDKLGPSIEWLRARGKSWDDIINTAVKTGGKDLGF